MDRRNFLKMLGISPAVPALKKIFHWKRPEISEHEPVENYEEPEEVVQLEPFKLCINSKDVTAYCKDISIKTPIEEATPIDVTCLDDTDDRYKVFMRGLKVPTRINTCLVGGYDDPKFACIWNELHDAYCNRNDVNITLQSHDGFNICDYTSQIFSLVMSAFDGSVAAKPFTIEIGLELQYVSPIV